MKIFVFIFGIGLSCSTLWMKIQTGNKSKHAWAHGLVNQGLWFLYIPLTHSWGLLPMTIGLSIIYIRNHFKWNREQDTQTETQDAKDRDLIKGM